MVGHRQLLSLRREFELRLGGMGFDREVLGGSAGGEPASGELLLLLVPNDIT